MIISQRTHRTISKLLSIAKLTDCGFKLSCGAVKNGKLLYIVANSNKTHTIAVDTKMQALHAEMGIVAMLRDLSGYDIIVSRWRPTGPGLAMPCNHCKRILKKAGCKKVTYTESQTWEEFSLQPKIDTLKL